MMPSTERNRGDEDAPLPFHGSKRPRMSQDWPKHLIEMMDSKEPPNNAEPFEWATACVISAQRWIRFEFARRKDHKASMRSIGEELEAFDQEFARNRGDASPRWIENQSQNRNELLEEWKRLRRAVLECSELVEEFQGIFGHHARVLADIDKTWTKATLDQRERLLEAEEEAAIQAGELPPDLCKKAADEDFGSGRYGGASFGQQEDVEEDFEQEAGLSPIYSRQLRKQCAVSKLNIIQITMVSAHSCRAGSAGGPDPVPWTSTTTTPRFRTAELDSVTMVMARRPASLMKTATTLIFMV